MRRVLITGGTGFIGSRLALRHLEGGDAVRILAQLNTPAERQNAEILGREGAEMQRGSVTDPDAVRSAVGDVDIVFHLAAAQHEANVPKQHFYDVNVEGTRILLEACADAGVGRVVHGSTIGVYGTEPAGPVHEDSPLTPENIYGITKLAGEEVVHKFARYLPTTIIRISETYGPGDRRLLKLFRGIANGRFFMIGRGDNLHHLVYVDDLIDGMQAAACEEQAIGEIVVLVGPEAITTREMVAHVAAAVGQKPPWLRLPLGPLMLLATTLEFVLAPIGVQPPLHRRRMNFFTRSFKFGGDKARAVLNFQPKIGFGRGAELTAAWYRDEGLQ